jgi:hypothetical protein
MSVVNLSVKHGVSFDEAKVRLDAAVRELGKLMGRMVQQVTWNSGRDRVRVEGAGFWLEMSVDAQDLHATGDIPALAGLMGGPLTAGLRRVVEQTIQRQLR